jgi:hypothetical protein
MNNKVKMLLGTLAVFALWACASADGPVYYDGYYDGYYGPLYDGYWGDDNFFYHSDGKGRPFTRDESSHFRHNPGAGFSSFHNPHSGPHTGHPHESAHR